QELISQQEALGFRLVTISVDGTRLPEFRHRTGGSKTPFPVLLDVGGQVCARYKVAHVPTVVIIDGAGRVRYTASGYPGNHVVLRELRKLASTTGITRLADCLHYRIPVLLAQEQELIVGVAQANTR